MRFLNKYYRLFFLVSIVLLNSCTFYYKTSDVNESLFELVKSVNSNYQKVDNEFTKANREYAKLKSNNEEEPFLTAKNKMVSLEKDMLSIAELKKNINDEYTEFKKYSKGKSKIASNSAEWSMIKQTKKNIQLLNKEISNEGEALIKNMESLNNYLNENIVPLVKIYKISDYQERYIQTELNIKKLRSENLKLLNEHRLIYNEIEKTHENSKDVIVPLRNHLSNVSKKVKELELFEKNIKERMEKFNEKTNGKIEVYNTEPLWNEIEEDQNALKSKVNEIQKIQSDIKNEFSSFQQLAKTLNAE